jgi:hypothetical protein
MSGLYIVPVLGRVCRARILLNIRDVMSPPNSRPLPLDPVPHGMTRTGKLGPLLRTRMTGGTVVARNTNNLVVSVQGWGWRAGRCTECQGCDTRCSYEICSISTKIDSTLRLSLILRRASHMRIATHAEASIADGLPGSGTDAGIWIHWCVWRRP